MKRRGNKYTGAWGRPDPWQGRVYAWENGWPTWNEGNLTLQRCRDILNMACKAYNLKPPVLQHHEGPATSFLSIDDTEQDAWFISMRHDHKNAAMVLHEAAHYITDRLHGLKATQDHGPTWQGVYFWLLARAELAPREALKASAGKHGLKWRETGPA